MNIIRDSLTKIFKSTPKIKENVTELYAHIDWGTRKALRAPQDEEKVLVIDASRISTGRG